jgi:uncharacterized protein
VGLHRQLCSGVDPASADRLAARLEAEPWFLRALQAVAASDLPEAWIGAGVIRDVVWGQLAGGFTPGRVRDIDVAFFDPADLSAPRDEAAEQALRELADLPWEATNQAAVHTWFHQHFGGEPVPPFGGIHDAVASWPETATCVAVRSTPHGLDVCAPYGLADLLGGVWRRNPARVSVEVSERRFADHRRRWPTLTVAPHDAAGHGRSVDDLGEAAHRADPNLY